MHNLPNEEQKYLQSLCQSVVRVLGRDNLLGIYLFGSASQGSYIYGQSDLDVQVVTKTALTHATKQQLVRALSHQSLPCPATKLEFVLYNKVSLRSAARPIYDINLNTGRDIAEHYSFDGTEDPWFWFALDIAIGRQHGQVLEGEAIGAAFPTMSIDIVNLAMLECLNWFIENCPDDPGCMDCARRCCVYLETGDMVSKKDAKSLFETLPVAKHEGRDLPRWVAQRLMQSVSL